MKVVTVIGVRPQFVKAAMVSRAIRAHDMAHRGTLEEVIVHTGQHFDADMSDIFFKDLCLPEPTYNLGVGGGSHGAMTGRQLEAIEKVLVGEKPDWVLVYGDTNSTLAGALAAVKLRIPVGHVEAGLRLASRRMPEEINRRLTDHMADLLFAPTQTAAENLRREGIEEGRVHRVGDVMLDAAIFFGPLAEERSCILETLGLRSKGYLLATVHRAENTDNPPRLRAIFEGFMALQRQIPVVIPLHPRTRTALEKLGLLRGVREKLVSLDPLGYLDMLILEKHARLIITDSGGVQKEAYFHKVPCVTLREATEWRETVDLGWNRLVGQDLGVIPDLLEMESAPDVWKDVEPYGDGTASNRIADLVARASKLVEEGRG